MLTDKTVHGIPLTRSGGRLRHTLLGYSPEQVARIEVQWPSPVLRTMTLVDTPGVGSVTEEASRHTTDLLSAESVERPVDAVIHLFRTRHADDLAMLQALRDGAATGAAHAAATTVGVLSRADEVGGGRLDSLVSAKDVAARQAEHPQLRDLCSDVLPVAGLLAQGARTLRQDDFDLLRTVAAMPREQRESVLVSVERFAAAEAAGGTVEGRSGLVRRIGLFGVRLGAVLLRQGMDRPGALADELARRSGLGRLRGIIDAQLAPRARALAGLAAASAVERLVDTSPVAGASGLLAACEALRAGEPAPEQMRLLSEVRREAVPGLDADDTTAARLLLGDQGMQPWRRLGLVESATPGDVVRAATASLDRWRTIAGDPLAREQTRRAARVLARSCEELLHGAWDVSADGSPVAT